MLKLGIPVLNRGDMLLRLVGSIDVPAEVLVVVNSIGPTDESVLAAVEELENKVMVVRVAGNLGVAGSWNFILDHFGGDCVISNSDIEFAPGVLRDALGRIALRPDVVMQHLWAAACFYAGAEFTRRLGWFDENIYPAYHEDQEIALRGAALGVERCNVFEQDDGRIAHGGSQTRKNASEAVQQFIRQAKGLSGGYLARRWGAIPPIGRELPERRFPFDNAALHPADWTLDVEARAAVAQLCAKVTGFECPIVYHRAEGGLCS